MARVHGDSADLPAGWEVDEDNWARRLVRNGDLDRLKRCGMGKEGSFIEDGFIYTMSAEFADAIDNA